MVLVRHGVSILSKTQVNSEELTTPGNTPCPQSWIAVSTPSQVLLLERRAEADPHPGARAKGAKELLGDIELDCVQGCHTSTWGEGRLISFCKATLPCV